MAKRPTRKTTKKAAKKRATKRKRVVRKSDGGRTPVMRDGEWNWAEYERRYRKTPEAKRKKNDRQNARRAMERTGQKKRGDGKQVDHIDGNTSNNSRSNLRVVSPKTNRSRARAGRPRGRRNRR